VNDIYPNKNIVCIWYPSGGFGHFVNAVLTLYGKNFVRPSVQSHYISSNGNSHQLPLVAPKFLHNQAQYIFNFKESDQKYAVLIDNGINNEGIQFTKMFPNATTIKLCYSDQSWPLVASTMIHKAMNSDLKTELAVDAEQWASTEHWAQREKYFLFLKEHQCRSGWRASTNCHNIFVEDLFDYSVFCQSLCRTGLEIADFRDLWDQWWQSNQRYIKPLQDALTILSAVEHRLYINLSSYTDLWTQAVVNYLIWVRYNYIVPANDYADWFLDTKQLISLLKHV
jgi:hypothetical protein